MRKDVDPTSAPSLFKTEKVEMDFHEENEGPEL